METLSGWHTSPIGSGYTLVPHRYPIWGTWGTFLLFPPFWGTYFSQPMRGNYFILCVRGFRRLCPALKILQDGSHFSGSQAAQLSHLSHLVKKRLILSRFGKKLQKTKLIKTQLGHLYLSVYENKGLKNSPGWVTLVYPTCTPFGVLGVHIGFVPHFGVHISINQ